MTHRPRGLTDVSAYCMQQSLRKCDVSTICVIALVMLANDFCEMSSSLLSFFFYEYLV